MTVVHEIAPSSAVSQIVDGASGVLLPDPTDLDGIVAALHTRLTMPGDGGPE